MCIKIVDGKMVINNYKTFFGIVASVVVSAGAIITQCNNGVVYAQNKFIAPVADSVCTEKIKQYDSTLQIQLKKIDCTQKKLIAAVDSFGSQQRLTNQLLKSMVSKKVLREAIREANSYGKLEIE